MNKKAILIGLALSVVAAEAQAISRHNIGSMSCARVQATVRAEGETILRWRGNSGVQRYERFVRSERFCDIEQDAVRATVPAADGSCPVLRCERIDPKDRYPWLRRRHWNN